MFVKPDFTEKFKCKAEKCTDNCCIGWEIDIDSVSLEKYRGISGAFGEELQKNITVSDDGSTCFCLCEGERCAFLDERNLCKIYANLGEDALCDICREHPRFYNECGSYTEMGLGICCEEAVRLLLTEPFFALVNDGKNCDLTETEKAVLAFRNELFDICKSASGIKEKCFRLAEEKQKELFPALTMGGTLLSDGELLDLLFETEPIDKNWLPLIEDINKNLSAVQKGEKEFNEKYPYRKEQYRKILAYLFYRHVFDGVFDGELSARTAFCLNNLRFIELFDIYTEIKNGTFTEKDTVDTVKYWSKQIEYSEENTEEVMFI